MKRTFSIALAFSLVIFLAGCKKNAASPENEIRMAIEAHLAHKGTLNLQAFDTVVKQVTIQGEHAQAQVEFHVKNGPGMMQLTYALERSGGNWAVVESNPVGADFSHPSLDPSQSPAAGAPVQPNAVLSEALRNFKTGTPSASPSLPPGHPPVVASPPTPPR
jgi:formamidopyrimidine-DNA glycosylase